MADKGENPDYLLKIVLIGDSGVGKTNILSHFISEKPALHSKPTIGVEFGSKIFNFGDTVVKAQIWDTAGQERYHAITAAYYRGSTGAVVVYDITRKESLTNAIDTWLKSLRESTEANIPVILLGNKVDLAERRKVSASDGKGRAGSENLGYFETSAVTGEKIQEAFEVLVRQIYERESKKENSSAKVVVRREDLTGQKLKEDLEGKKKKSSCC